MLSCNLITKTITIHVRNSRREIYLFIKPANLVIAWLGFENILYVPFHLYVKSKYIYFWPSTRYNVMMNLAILITRHYTH